MAAAGGQLPAGLLRKMRESSSVGMSYGSTRSLSITYGGLLTRRTTFGPHMDFPAAWPDEAIGRLRRHRRTITAYRRRPW